MEKILNKFIVAAVLLTSLFSAAALAQNAPISGKVEMKKGDVSVPVVGATVEIFRTDIKSSGPTDKTDKKGQFSFVGLLIGGTYVISVSAPGASPTYLPNVKPGAENLTITMSEGDGRRLTADEVRAALSSSPNIGGESTGDLTPEQKKQQEAYKKQVAEVESKNAKIKQETAIIEASLKEGNEAYTAKNFDLALAKYNEGINANPTFAGSAPVLMNNKGVVLRERAVATYNKTVKAADVSAKVEGLKQVRADLSEAADTYYKSWNILNAAQPGDISNPQLKESQTATALRGAVDTFRLMAQTEQVDDSKMEIAKAMVPVANEKETDPARKDQGKLILGDLYRVAGDADNAIAEYRKVLEASPDNLDAQAGLGLSLVNAGYINNNKEQLQEGANFLQKYATSAPDGHKFKKDALDLIESLKADQKIAPQKVTTKRKN